MLNARELKVFYGVIQGLKGVDIDVYDRRSSPDRQQWRRRNLHPQWDRGMRMTPPLIRQRGHRKRSAFPRSTLGASGLRCQPGALQRARQLP